MSDLSRTGLPSACLATAVPNCPQEMGLIVLTAGIARFVRVFLVGTLRVGNEVGLLTRKKVLSMSALLSPIQPRACFDYSEVRWDGSISRIVWDCWPTRLSGFQT